LDNTEQDPRIAVIQNEIKHLRDRNVRIDDSISSQGKMVARNSENISRISSDNLLIKKELEQSREELRRGFQSQKDYLDALITNKMKVRDTPIDEYHDKERRKTNATLAGLGALLLVVSTSDGSVIDLIGRFLL